MRGFSIQVLAVHFFLYLMTTSAHGFQSGTITGRVIDSKTKEPLPGANVVIEGTAMGTSTNIEGVYRIANVPIGSYNLIISYIGYIRQIIPVSVQPDQVTEINAELDFEAIEQEGVTVTALLEGQARAINQQIASNTIVNVVSADRIRELPDVNAAEAIARLPGVSIKRSGGEGQKVVVRGLSPTYNAITIGGERLPATDLDDRSVDLSMISPDILAGITVTKALTPDKDADSFGGAVDFQLAEAPSDGFRFSVNAQNGYNHQQTEFGQYKGYFVLSDRFLEGKLGLLVTGNTERTQRGSDQLEADYSVVREKRPDEDRAPIQLGTLDLKDRIERRRRSGGSVLLDYKFPDGKLLLSNFVSRLERSELTRTRGYSTGSNQSWYNFRNRDITVDMLSNSFRGEYALPFANVDWRFSRSAALQKHPYDNEIRFQEKAAFDQVQLATAVNRGPEAVVAAARNNIAEAFLYDGRFRREKALEKDLSTQLNVKVSYVLGESFAGYLKFGGKYRGKVRDRDAERFESRLDNCCIPDGFTNADIERNHSRYGDPDFQFQRTTSEGQVSFLNYLDSGFDAGRFLGGSFVFGPGVDSRESTHFLPWLVDSVYYKSRYTDLNDFRAEENVAAGYIMTEINIGPRLMVFPGIRYEYTRTEFSAKIGEVADDEDETGSVRDTTAGNSYGRWFPMLHIRYRLTDWFDIRGAWTQTISRPTFEFITPRVQILGNAKTVKRGVPTLKPQISTNYDLFLSFYSNKIGLFTIGGFYKTIDNLIWLREGVVILDPAAEGEPPNLKGFQLTTPANNPLSTKVKGFEIEWQTNFTWLPSPLDGFVLNVNYTRIFSETQFPRSILARETVFPFRTSRIDTFRVGNMPDQANHIANIAAGYDKAGFSARLSMLYQGRTLSKVGTRFEVDGFADELMRFDLSVKQDITETFSIFLTWNNISNRPDRSFQQTAGFPTAQEFYGWTADLGIRYKL